MLLTKQLLAFRPNKMDWIFATKTFVAGMLALYIAFSLNLAYPIWAIGTVFVIAKPLLGHDLFKKSLSCFRNLAECNRLNCSDPAFDQYPVVIYFFPGGLGGILPVYFTAGSNPAQLCLDAGGLYHGHYLLQHYLLC